ncbi:MAG: hypothetical protein GY913_12375 [Proteobacteria bacterium]|nr:hypothetical protein [Pseudomonadota bacterium]MCP4917712.1 hypothetical protein [Pseudomonadota bacterium]
MTWLALVLGARATVTPTPAERARLEAGQVVVRVDTARGGSNGLSMMVVEAAADEVWQVIIGFDAYVEFLPYVTASTLRSDSGDGRYGYDIELTTRGIVTRYAGTAVHDGDTLSWELQPVGVSPMRKSSGSWRVQDLDGRTLLIYRAEAETAWWLPSSVHRKAADAGLPTMVRLVGERAVGSQGGG